MDFKVDKSVFVYDFRSLLKCEFDLEGVNPGRHKVSVYRNQVKKKLVLQVWPAKCWGRWLEQLVQS